MNTYVKCFCLAAVMTTVWGCNKKATPSQEPLAKPATVQNPVKETDLTTVTLTPEAESRLGIQVTPVESRPVEKTRMFGGEVVPVSGRSATVATPLAGTLLLPPDGATHTAGRRVAKGQPLYRLLLALPEKDLLTVQETVALKKIECELAQTKAKRTQQLRDDKSGSVKDWEDAQAQLASAKAGLEIAEARLELLKSGDLNSASDGRCTLTIKSPLDGIIQEVYSAPGQTVTGATALLSIAGVDPVWIKVPVYVGELTTIDTEKPARIHGLADVAGTQSRLAEPVGTPFSANPASATADLFYELSNADFSYRVGQKVGVTVTLRASGQSLVVPYPSVVYDMYGGTWVYLNGAPHAYVRQRVEVLHVLGDLAILSRGPAVGAKVVSAGAAELFGTEFGVGK